MHSSNSRADRFEALVPSKDGNVRIQTIENGLGKEGEFRLNMYAKELGGMPVSVEGIPRLDLAKQMHDEAVADIKRGMSPDDIEVELVAKYQNLLRAEPLTGTDLWEDNMRVKFMELGYTYPSAEELPGVGAEVILRPEEPDNHLPDGFVHGRQLQGSRYIVDQAFAITGPVTLRPSVERDGAQPLYLTVAQCFKAPRSNSLVVLSRDGQLYTCKWAQEPKADE